MSNHDKLEGKAKEVAGKVSGDDQLEAEGKTQHAMGKVEEKAAGLKDSAKGAFEAAKDTVSGDDEDDEDDEV